MNIAYFEPLNRGWHRMVQALFQPFDIKKWFVVGFSVFLAQLLDDGSSAGGGYRFDNKDNGWDNIDKVADLPQTVLNWLADNPIWAIIIMIGIVVLIAVLIVLTWISSRGKFMFLDNVVHNRALITEPWNRFRHLGNSLFLWRLGFGIITILVFTIFAASAFFILKIDEGFEINLPSIILLGLLFLLIIAILIFIIIMLNSFVIPIMYKNDIKINAAWKEYSKILWPNFFSFILYTLFFAVLYIAAAIVIVVAGFAMCCVGFILLVIPYINTVITLPIAYTFRTFSLEFLAQFGSGYTLFPSENPDLQELGGVE